MPFQVRCALGLVLLALSGGLLPDLSWRQFREQRPGRGVVIGALAIYVAMALWFTRPLHPGDVAASRLEGFALTAMMALICVWLTLGADHRAAICTLVLATFVSAAIPPPAMPELPALPRAVLSAGGMLVVKTLALALLFSIPIVLTARLRLLSVLRLWPGLAAIVVAGTPVAVVYSLVVRFLRSGH